MSEPVIENNVETTNAAPPPAKRGRLSPRQRRLARFLFIGLVVVLIAGGLLFWSYSSVRESTDDAQIEGDIVPMAARVGGTVEQVFVSDNQQVKAGDVLVQIDPSDYKVALQRAEAELADAQANAAAARTTVPITSSTSTSQLNVARANLNAARKEVDAARARLAEAQANQKRTASDLERFEQLVKKDEISRQQYDAAVAAATASRATVDAASAAVATAESHVAQADAQLRGAQSAPQQVQVSQAKAGSAQATGQAKQAAVDQAKLNLSYTTVKAPTAGIISRKNVQVGQIVQPGQPLLAIVPLENVWVVANFKENQLRQMRVGQAVTIHVDAYGRDYTGRVDSIGGATAAKFSLLPPENATGNYVKVVQRVPVKIVFDAGQDPEHRLRPGLSVVPTVRLDSVPAGERKAG